MYIIINRTTNTCVRHAGDFPSLYLHERLDRGDRLIVLSFYSKTIKVPYFTQYNGITEWEWESFPFDKETLKNFNKQVTN